jgi:hypothetical protein
MKDITSVIGAYETRGQELIRRLAPLTDQKDLLDALGGLLPESAKELQELCKFFEREMLLCRDAGAYFSGCLSGAAMIESFLLLFCLLEQSAVERSRTFHSNKKKKHPYKEVLALWTLKDLIPLAEELQWIGPKTVEPELVKALVDAYREMLPAAKPGLADHELNSALRSLEERPDVVLLSLMQSMRNLVHGGRCVRLRKRLWSEDFSEWAKLVMVLTVEVRDCMILRLEAAYKQYATDLMNTSEGVTAFSALYNRFVKTPAR